MKKSKVGALIFVVVSAVVVGIVAFSAKNPFWSNVVKAVQAGQKDILMRDMTSFDWDKVCILTPYFDVQNNKAVSEAIQGELGPFQGKLPSMDSEDSWLFVFIKGGKVIQFAQKGWALYLEFDSKNNCFSKDVAKFLVLGTDDYYLQISE